MAAIFGYTVDELVENVRVEALVLPEDWPMVEENISQRICGKSETTSYQFRGITKNGEIIRVGAYGSCANYDGGPAVIGTLLDITQSIEAEAEWRGRQTNFGCFTTWQWL